MTFCHFPEGDWVLLIYKNGDKYNEHCSGEERRAMIMISCDKTKAAVSFQSSLSLCCLIVLFFFVCLFTF